MKKTIFRNIAIVSAVFILAFSIMLITNYFQVKGANPLQTEVIETLKQINDANSENAELKEQIRQLDLLARRAYFVNIDHLMGGVYILLFMLAAFFVSLRFYFAKEKDIPDKHIDPIDEWIIKTNARKYVRWGAAGLVCVALGFVFLSSPYLKRENKDASKAGMEQMEDGSGLLSDASSEDGYAAYESSLDNAGASSDGSDGSGVSDGSGGTEVSDSSSIAGSQSDGSGLSSGSEQTNGTSATGSAGSDLTAGGEAAQGAGTTESSAGAEIPKVTHNGFRGNNSGAFSAAKGIPTKWNLATGDNIEWKSEIPKKGYNSPVINGSRVFLTGADEQARELYCYDLFTGKMLWTLAATGIPGSPAQMPKTTDDTGLAASTVATNGKFVCAVFASGDLICADMEGKRVWAKNLGVPDNHYGYASSLLVFGNSLIVQYDNNNSPQVISLDIATGNERWRKTRADKIAWSSPVITYVNNSPQLVLLGNPGFMAYNPNNGEQLWRVECMTGEVAASPCGSSGIVFGASEYATLIAVDATSGKELWRTNDYLPEVSSPVATKDFVYVATSYGVLACFDAKTGELKHAHELETEFYSSPMIVEGKLYIFSNSGEMFIFSTNSEFKQLNKFGTGEMTYATPAFTDGRIVVRTENGLYCVVNKG